MVDLVIASDRLLAPADVAQVLGVPTATLANWRSGRTGPLFLKIGRLVRYRGADLDAWIDEQVVRHREVVIPGR